MVSDYDKSCGREKSKRVSWCIINAMNILSQKRTIVFVSMLGVLGSIGFGRFALGMLLPSMSKALGLTYSQMGLLSTLNFLGYLTTALLSGVVLRYGGTRLTVFVALLFVGASMVLIGSVNAFVAISVLYAITGLGSGASNVPLMGLVTQWFESRYRGRVAGILVSGSALGIVLSSVVVPFINKSDPVNGWRTGWQVFGLVVIIIATVCLFFVRDRVSLKRSHKEGSERYFDSNLMLTYAIYFLFGFSYVIYVTFFVSFLVNECGLSESVAGGYWMWVGILSIIAGPLFGTLSDKAGRAKALIFVFICQSISYIIAGMKLGFPGGIYISVLLFGLVSLSIPSIVAALIGDMVGPRRTSAIFGVATFVFGLGQIAGPAIAGYLSDITGSLSAGFYLATVGAVLAGIVSGVIYKRGY